MGEILEIVPADVFARMEGERSATDGRTTEIKTDTTTVVESGDKKQQPVGSEVSNPIEGRRNEFRILNPGIHNVVSYIW